MRRVLRYLFWIILILLLVLYIGFPLVMALAVIVPDNADPGEPPEGFTSVTLTTSDDVQLGAWYLPPENGAVIILVHGAGNGRETMRGYAAMLQENGFGVLAVSMRGYGDSEGRINRLGWSGTKDIGAAVDFLIAQTDVEAIGGLGTSMGGEILLGAAETYPMIQAIVADGATSRSGNEYVAIPKNRSIVRNFTTYVHSYFVQILTGTSQPEPIVDSIAAAADTRFLFIAAGNEQDEIDFNTVFAETVTTRGELWIVLDVGHTAAFNRYPDEYEARVVAFFTDVLLSE